MSCGKETDRYNPKLDGLREDIAKETSDVSRQAWDNYFIDIVKVVKSKSKDRSRQVGCVVVGQAKNILSTGYNGFARGVNDNDDERHQRPDKYLWVCHAEANAVYNAARHGVKLEDSTAYLIWFPCANCANALAQAGVVEVVSYAPDFHDETWGKSFRIAHTILSEAGVKMRTIPGVMDAAK